MEIVRIKWLERWFQCRFLAPLKDEKKQNLSALHEKELIKLTGSQKAQSHMMVANALLSWLPWTMTTRGSEIIYKE